MTQESIIAYAWKDSGGEITTAQDGDFFNALYNFRLYCQVSDYDEVKVSPTHISRILKQLS
jgi:hypothetical protein